MIGRLEVLPGAGTAARFDEVVVWAGPAASSELVVFLVQSAHNLGATPDGGQRIADHLAGILSDRRPEPATPFATVGPGTRSPVALLHGPVQLWDGARWVRPDPATGWMVVEVPDLSTVLVTPHETAAPPSSNPILDLEAGVVPGGGLAVLLAPPVAPGQAVAGPVSLGDSEATLLAPPATAEQVGLEEAGAEEAGAEQAGTEQAGTEQAGTEQAGTEQAGAEQAGTEEADLDQAGTEHAGAEEAGVEDSEAATVLTELADPAGAEAATVIELPVPADARPASDLVSDLIPAPGPLGAAPAPARPAAFPAGLESSLATTATPLGTVNLRAIPEARLPALPASGQDDGTAPGSVVVQGLRCSSGHLNHPAATLCLRCGQPLDPARGQSSGPRPALGVLIATDGGLWRIDASYLIGTAPWSDTSVMARQVRALPVAEDGQVEPVHAELRATDWTLSVVDRHTSSGTFVLPPGGQGWQRVPANQAVPLRSGTHLAVGSTVFTFSSPWPL